MPTLIAQTLLHQRKARQHSNEAQHAVLLLQVSRSVTYRDEALYHQSMASFHAERAWTGLLSLLLIDPII